MQKPLKRAIIWTPRILALAFVIFISLFALDVFGQGYGFWGTLLALLIHLVPTYLVVIALALAWRWEWVGAVLFAGLGLLYLLVFRNEMDGILFLLIPGPLFLVGILFALNWALRQRLRTPS